MEKIKLIFFGANTELFQKANVFLRLDNCEIVAICDNDINKQGIIWQNLPVIPASKLNEMTYDFVIIGAWYSYHDIRKSLINIGVPENKILPLLSIKSVMFLNGVFDYISEEILNKLFKDNATKLHKRILELNDIDKKYHEVVPLENENKLIDFADYPIIAHAGGGKLGNEEIIYTNSIEAFQTAVKNGFKMIECDIFGIVDDDLIFAHDGYKLNAANISDYTSLNLSFILSILAKNSDLKVMLDIKWSTFHNYKQLLETVESIISKENAEWNYEVKQQLIVQGYNFETVEYAVKNNWQCVLIDYRDNDGIWFKKSAWLCCKFNLSGAIFQVSALLKNSKYLKFLKDKNVPIIAYTTDSIDDYSKLKALGVVSVISNLLRPQKLQ